MWSPGEAPTKIVTTASRQPHYLNSPLRIVDETGQPFRRRLDGAVPGHAATEELRRPAQPTTSSCRCPSWTAPVLPPYLSRRRLPDRFSDSEIAALELAARLISPYAERRVLRRIAVDLLDTYVGHHAGERIFSGQIRRGAVDTIEAAILMATCAASRRCSKGASAPK